MILRMTEYEYRRFNAMRSTIKFLVKAQLTALPNGEECFHSKRYLINQMVEDEARKIVEGGKKATCKNDALLPIAVRIVEAIKSDKGLTYNLSKAILPNLF